MMLKFTEDHEWLRLTAALRPSVSPSTPKISLVIWSSSSCRNPERALTRARGGGRRIVKAASDVYAPISGQIIDVNPLIVADPALVNSDPLGRGWFFKLKIADRSQVDTLMDEAAYKAQLRSKE